MLILALASGQSCRARSRCCWGLLAIWHRGIRPFDWRGSRWLYATGERSSARLWCLPRLVRGVCSRAGAARSLHRRAWHGLSTLMHARRCRVLCKEHQGGHWHRHQVVRHWPTEHTHDPVVRKTFNHSLFLTLRRSLRNGQRTAGLLACHEQFRHEARSEHYPP